MRFKLNYFVIPLIVALVDILTILLGGGKEALMSIRVWPSIAALVILGGIIFRSIPVILFWNRFPRQEPHFLLTAWLFILFGISNILRGYLFYTSFESMPVLPILASILLLAVGLIIVISLWIHHVYAAAYWSIACLIWYAFALSTAYTQTYIAITNKNIPRSFQYVAGVRKDRSGNLISGLETKEIE